MLENSLFRGRVNVWQSRTGNASTENRDAAGIYSGRQQTIAVVVDAASRGRDGVRLARHWVEAVVASARRQFPSSPAELIASLRISHSGLRSLGFTHEIAAYAILVIDLHKRLQWALSCGDCRIGALNGSGQLEWVTPVHTAANPLGEPFEQHHASHSCRHTLTKRLRVASFDPPVATLLGAESAQQWLLATDGYWIEHLMLGKSIDTLDDDSSVLSLVEPEQRVVSRSIDSNFLSL